VRRHHEDVSQDQGQPRRGRQVRDLRLRQRDRLELHRDRDDQGQDARGGHGRHEQGRRGRAGRPACVQAPLFGAGRGGHQVGREGLLRQERHRL